MDLNKYGWNTYFESQLQSVKEKNIIPGRIICQQKKIYTAICEKGEVQTEASGNFIYHVTSLSDYPAVGDWVLLRFSENGDTAVIRSVLNRNNFISRNAAGSNRRSSGGPVKEQMIAANIDMVFIVSGLDRDFNLRRIERYLALTYNSGAVPVIILNKADLCDAPEEYVSHVEQIAFGVPVISVTATDSSSIKKIETFLDSGKSIVLLGSSGVGKSTIINTLMNEDILKVNVVSNAVNKGVHTTTHRELFILPNGGIIIDNPGMRELSFYDDVKGIDHVFKDIEILTKTCRFSDCQHESEPGCAVKSSIKKGTLTIERLNSYMKLKKEIIYIEERKHKSANTIEKEKWKDIRKLQKNIYKNNKSF